MPRTIFDDDSGLAEARTRRGLFTVQRRSVDGASCAEEVFDSSYAMEVLDDTPVAYYPCQEFAGMLKDIASGYHMEDFFYDGSINHMPYYRLDGPLTSACDKAIGDLAAVAPNFIRLEPIITSVDDFTIEAWVYPATADASYAIFYNGYVGNDGYGMFLGKTGGSLYLRGAIGSGGTPDSADAVDVDEWSHLVVQRDSGTWRFYINGAASGTGGTTAPSTPTSDATYGGAAIHCGADANGWKAAHIAFYDSVLSSGRIAAHYAAR